MVTPAATGGLVTACICVALEDPDAHHARATAAGAAIMVRRMMMSMAGAGMRRGIARANVWSFGSYDPYA